MVKFPELAKCMASIGMTKKELSELIGKSPNQASYKLRGKTEFKLSEISIITSFFRQKEVEKVGSSDLTSDKIFYTDDN